MKSKERRVYEVTTYLNSGTEQVYAALADRLTSAVKLFDAQVAPVITDPGMCVLLVRVKGDHSGIVLASKSTKQTWVEFTPAYYDEAK